LITIIKSAFPIAHAHHMVVCRIRTKHGPAFPRHWGW